VEAVGTPTPVNSISECMRTASSPVASARRVAFVISAALFAATFRPLRGVLQRHTSMNSPRVYWPRARAAAPAARQPASPS